MAEKRAMTVKRVITIEQVIYQCKFSCPYYSDTAHEMRCEHPKAPNDGYIIEHPDCMNGFPKLCPEVKAQSGKA